MKIVLAVMENEDGVEDVVLRDVEVEVKEGDPRSPHGGMSVGKIMVAIGDKVAYVDPNELRRAAEALAPIEDSLVM